MSEPSPTSPCNDTWIAPGNLFTKTLTSKGFGYYCPQDGSLCKVKVLQDDSNIIKDINEEQIKEIIIGDVDDPLERILEMCVQSMKNEEIAVFKFADPFQPCQIAETSITSPETEVPPENETITSPTEDEDKELSEQLKPTENEVAEETTGESMETESAGDSKEAVPEDDSKEAMPADDSKEAVPACNGEDETTEVTEKENCSGEDGCPATSSGTDTEEKNCSGEKGCPATSSGTDAETSATETAPQDLQCPDAEMSDSNDCETYNEKTPIMYQVTLQLISYTREPEIWEMSITEKWRRANYHKQKGMLLYSQGSYEWAFRRFGLSLKYIVSLEHDIPPDHEEEGMNIVELKLSCYLNLAACQMRHYNYTSVIKNCTKALDIQADNSKAIFRRGAAYIQIQEYEKAKEDLDKAQQLEPKNQAIVKQQQLLRARVQKLNQYYAKAMKKMFS